DGGVALEGEVCPEPVRRPAEDGGEDATLPVEPEARGVAGGGQGEVPEDRTRRGDAPEPAQGAHPHAPRVVLEKRDDGPARGALRIAGSVAGEASRLEIEHCDTRRLAGTYPQPVVAVHEPPLDLCRDA